eukprot:m.181430 g.181430  ORF g.181430 m.181430 type:complete len:51 (-) comp14964_c0_seq2:3666-3818(-)
MLRWGSLRHDGFTHGEITTGFEQFGTEHGIVSGLRLASDLILPIYNASTS